MSDSDLAPELRALVARMWEAKREPTLQRLDVLQGLIRGAVSPEAASALDKAHHIAHQLAGSLGTFGLAEGSRIAGDLEEALAPPGPVGEEELRRLDGLVAQLRVVLTSDR